jgi:hypothetical protein
MDMAGTRLAEATLVGLCTLRGVVWLIAAVEEWLLAVAGEWLAAVVDLEAGRGLRIF